MKLFEKLNIKLRKIKQGGFSLVELSVVLTIIGVTLAGALDLATRKTEASRISETNARLDAIETALKVYLLNNQKLPCPASSTAALNTSTAGTSSMTGTACTSHTYAYTYTYTYNSVSYNTVFYTGSVPVKELGLPDKMIADDWDRRFTYTVDRRFVNNPTTAGGASNCLGYAANPAQQMCFKNTTIISSAAALGDQTSIRVNDSVSGVASSRVTDAIYTIISHGRNGYGAFSYGGTTAATQLAQPGAPDANEVSNAPTANVGTFPTLVYGSTASTFDDIMRYSTKASLIEGAGGVTDSTSCTAAWENSQASAFNPCASATSVANCNSLATRVNLFCLQP